jgi:hypothetical protein
MSNGLCPLVPCVPSQWMEELQRNFWKPLHYSRHDWSGFISRAYLLGLMFCTRRWSKFEPRFEICPLLRGPSRRRASISEKFVPRVPT